MSESIYDRIVEIEGWVAELRRIREAFPDARMETILGGAYVPVVDATPEVLARVSGVEVRSSTKDDDALRTVILYPFVEVATGGSEHRRVFVRGKHGVGFPSHALAPNAKRDPEVLASLRQLVALILSPL